LARGKAELGKMEFGKKAIGKKALGKAELGKMVYGKVEPGDLLELGKAELGKAELGKADSGEVEPGKAELGKVVMIKKATSIQQAIRPINGNNNNNTTTMKTYKELQEEIQSFITELNDTPVPGTKRAFYRDDNRGTSTDGLAINSRLAKEKKEVIGWFSNKNNPAFGWAIFKLTDNDIEWLKDKLPDLKNVFRTSSDKETSIIKIKSKTGTYSFMDNKYYENSDDVRFEKASAYKKLVIDDEKYVKLFM
jgi:hypothetical protein